MKVTELRIGNYAHCTQFSDEIEILDISNSVISYVTFHEKIHLSSQPIGIEPIPLTEEWLLKFGFKKYSQEIKEGRFKGLKLEEHFYKEWVRLFNVLGDGYFQLRTPTGYVPITVKYVHQLQNLYFALTEEELIIKKPS